MREEEDERFT